jgi:hypothetical protein
MGQLMTCDPLASSHGFRARLPWLILALVVGSALRFIWPADMEWKADEIWMFDAARAIADGREPWPWVGMMNSAGFPNPGLSVWFFALLAAQAKTPVALVRWVQVLNVVALWMAFYLAFWRVKDPQERAIWLNGLALAAVSPVAILFSRKIWAQDVLPIVAVLFWVAHACRNRRWGAGAWGLIGALIGQIHMSGFFLAAGVWVWTLYAQLRSPQMGASPVRSVRWSWWLGGTLLGVLPMLPWLRLVSASAGSSSRTWVALLVPKFFAHWWATSLGVNLGYSLGTHFWSDFLPWPVVLGHPIYLVAIAHGLLLGLGFWGLIRWFRFHSRPMARLLDPGRTHLSLDLRASGLAVGTLFALLCLPVPLHYLIVVFPWPFIWLKSIFPESDWRWALILVSQLILSILFLALIHHTGGFADSDYGLVYRLSSAQR